MKTRILNLLLPVLALTAAACGDSFEFGTPTHDLDEGTDLSAGTTQVLWKNKGAVYPTKRIHNFRIPGLDPDPAQADRFLRSPRRDRLDQQGRRRHRPGLPGLDRRRPDLGPLAGIVRRRGQHLRKRLRRLDRKRPSGGVLLLGAHRNHRSEIQKQLLLVRGVAEIPQPRGQLLLRRRGRDLVGSVQVVHRKPQFGPRPLPVDRLFQSRPRAPPFS